MTAGMPLERASIATWLVGTAGGQNQPPPDDQSMPRKRDGARSTAATIAPGGTATSIADPVRWASTRSRRSWRSAARARKYSSSDVLVTRDFCLHRVEPRAIRGVTRHDRGEGRLCKCVVLEQRDLEFQDFRRVARRPVDEIPQVGASGDRSPRRNESASDSGRPEAGARARTGVDRKQRAQRDPREKRPGL